MFDYRRVNHDLVVTCESHADLGIPWNPFQEIYILWSQQILQVVLDIDLPSELPRFLWTAAAEQGAERFSGSSWGFHKCGYPKKDGL